MVRKRAVTLMGSRFDITISAKTDLAAEAYIDTAVVEITRIENVISEWREATLVSEINRNAGIKPVKVTKELFDLTQRAIRFSEISHGAFDITFASMDKIWKFDGSMTELPKPKHVRKAIKIVGYQNIIMDAENSTIFLKLPGMKIGFGSTGKGYAADKTKDLLMAKGVEAGIINASGDMNSWGKQPDGTNWTVGIADPLDSENVFAVFPLFDSAVVTSGDYEKFIMLGGKKYSHIIDPRTGYPARGISSVTVFAKSAELANGFSTSIIVMGKEAGLDMVNQIPEIGCIIVDQYGKMYYSKNIDIEKFLK